MTTDNLPERTAEAARAWALAHLGAPRDAAPETVRAAWLRRLPDEEFVPPLAWYPARPNAASGAESFPLEEFLEKFEAKLRERVDDFASEFFTLAPAERRQRYEQLVRACNRLPTLAERLRLLQPGLDFQLGRFAQTDERIRKLAEYAAELFVLRPDAAALRRQALQRDWDGDLASWASAAQEAVHRHPELQMLERVLLQWLVHRGKKKPRRSLRAVTRSRTLISAPERLSASRSRGETISWGALGGVLLLMVNLMRLLLWNSPPSSRPVDMPAMQPAKAPWHGPLVPPGTTPPAPNRKGPWPPLPPRPSTGDAPRRQLDSRPPTGAGKRSLPPTAPPRTP